MSHSKLKSMLEKKLLELKTRALEIQEKLSDPGEKDWEENAIELEDDEVRIGIGKLTKKEISEIERTLSLIESGDYGKCTVCGKSIETDRLELLPFTLTCIKCA